MILLINILCIVHSLNCDCVGYIVLIEWLDGRVASATCLVVFSFASVNLILLHFLIVKRRALLAESNSVSDGRA